MLKPESVPENKADRIIGDFEIPTVHRIPARTTEVVII